MLQLVLCPQVLRVLCGMQQMFWKTAPGVEFLQLCSETASLLWRKFLTRLPPVTQPARAYAL